MSRAREIAAQALGAALEQAAAEGISADVLARTMLTQVIGVWKRERRISDIASELEFTIENLDDDQTFSFMRP